MILAVKYRSMSQVEEKDERVERESKIERKSQSALLKHRQGIGNWDLRSRRKENKKVITIMKVV